MRKRVVLPVVIIVAIVIATIVVVLWPGNKESRGPKAIGVILPVTGPSAYIGKAVQAGMDLAIQEITETVAPEEPSIKLSYVDSRGQATDAVSAFRKLVTVDKAPVVVTVASAPRALAPLAERAKVVLFCTVTSSSGIAELGQWVFRFFTNAAEDASLMAEFAVSELNLKNLAVVYLNDEFGKSYYGVFKKGVESRGAAVVASEAFGFGDTDFRIILSKVKTTNPDGVYILGYSNNLGLIPLQMREIGLKAKILSIGTLGQQQVIQQAGGAVEGAYFTTTAFDLANPATEGLRRFVQKFKERYQKRPEFFEVFGYDTVMLLNEATRSTEIHSQQIRDNLMSVSSFAGASGEISVDETGEVHFPIVIKQIRSGELHLVDFARTQKGV